ncbi:MAG: B12-binding domain-containing protein [Candidatus Lokiarchaeota archaeon]|nr:B12-binding domain-containing protein [Candidatus Lokiarchaeota archaeon]
MNKGRYFEEISDAIVNLEEGRAVELAERAITGDMDVLEVIEKGFGTAINKIGKLWETGEYFLPELMLGGTIVQRAMDVLLPRLKAQGKAATFGKVLVATIEGDIHSIGKNIVATMLSANGFEVVDLGVDVPVERIIAQAIEQDVDAIGVSALLTTTMPGQKALVEAMVTKGVRDKFKVFLGGAAVNAEWVKHCGADGYAENAIDAVKLIKEALRGSSKGGK